MAEQIGIEGQWHAKNEVGKTCDMGSQYILTTLPRPAAARRLESLAHHPHFRCFHRCYSPPHYFPGQPAPGVREKPTTQPQYRATQASCALGAWGGRLLGGLLQTEFAEPLITNVRCGV